MSEAHARSRAGGLFFLSTDPAQDPNPPLNSVVHVVSSIMCNVIASASKISSFNTTLRLITTKCAPSIFTSNILSPLPQQPLQLPQQQTQIPRN
jgi:hypothetical protein